MLTNFAVKITSPDAIPSQRHFAILVFKTTSTHVPGDERSRTNPGHGYPAHDVVDTSYEYWAIGEKKDLEGAIKFLEERKKESYLEPDPYRVVEVRPVEVKIEIEVKIASTDD